MRPIDPHRRLHVITYSADSLLRNPWLLLRGLARDLWASRSIALELLRRNLAGEYRRSLLGVTLAFVPAIVTAAWCTAVQHARIINIEALDLPYPAFVLLSMVLWTTFVEAIFAPITGLLEELPTLARASFPAEAVILARCGEVVINFCVKLVLLLAAIVWFHLPISWMAVLAPLGVALLILLGTAIGLFLAPLNALYRDISKGLAAVTTFWLFLTPVIVPVPKSGWAAVVVRYNPVTPLLATTRELATTGDVSDPVAFIGMAIATCLLFLVGAAFHRLALPVIMDRTNA